MRTRRFQFALVGCLVAILAIWVLWPGGNEMRDDVRFAQMNRAANWGWRFRSMEKRLPGPLVRLLPIENLRKRYMKKADVQEEALLASGYLTNASIVITNLPFTIPEKSCLREVQSRLRKGAPVDFVTFSVESNLAFVTCRSKDLALVRNAIEAP